MRKEYNLLVFIGRFQPFHNGHKAVIDEALERADNVLVLIGSAGKARTVRNPFTFEERANMIFNCYRDRDLEYQGLTGERPVTSRLIFKPLYDKTYNDSAWITQIQTIVKETCLNIANRDTGNFRPNGIADIKVGLIGAAKDHTSYYLKLFPQWESIDVPVQGMLHATNIREGIMEGRFERYCVQETLLPKQICDFLFDDEVGFIHTEAFAQLKRELEFIKNYMKQWKAAPYPVKHVTVDAVVEQSGHILMVRRKSEPGKGLLAIPGGHLNEFERLEDGAIRELREETKIKVPDAVLRGSIYNVHTFDDPHRSTIGRVITQAYHIKLADDTKLPKVRGADDAEKAIWVPIADLKEDECFDDHFHIIEYFLGV